MPYRSSEFRKYCECGEPPLWTCERCRVMFCDDHARDLEPGRVCADCADGLDKLKTLGWFCGGSLAWFLGFAPLQAMELTAPERPVPLSFLLPLLAGLAIAGLATLDWHLGTRRYMAGQVVPDRGRRITLFLIFACQSTLLAVWSLRMFDSVFELWSFVGLAAAWAAFVVVWVLPARVPLPTLRRAIPPVSG